YVRRTPGSTLAIRSANRAAFTSSNSDRVHWKCSLSMSAGYSGEHESLENQAAIGMIEASTVALPSIGMEIGDGSWRKRVLVRCSPFQGSMRAMMVEVGPEIEQLVFEIRRGPEQGAIQILASNRAVLLRIP